MDRRRAVTLLLAALPALFLLLFLATPLLAFLRLSGLDWDLGAWERGRLWASLRLGLATSVLALAAGLPLAYVLGRHRFAGRRALRAIVTVPFVMPVVVMAAGILAFLGPRGILARATGLDIDARGTTWALLLAHTVYNAPIVIRLVGDAWARLDPRIEAAAATLGAGPWTRFARVTLPRLAPALLAAALLTFLFGFTAFGTVLLVGDPIADATIEVGIYHAAVVRFDLAAASALALIQLVVTLAASFAYVRLVERASTPEAPVGESALRPLREAPRALVAVGFTTALLLVLPLLAVLARAFDTPAGWSFEAFARVLSPDARGAFVTPLLAVRNSLGFAALTMLVALPLGALAAFAVARARRGALADALWMAPLGASAVTVGLGLLLVFPWRSPWGEWDLRATAWLLGIAHVLVAFPFVVRALVGPVRARDPRLVDAARALGATRWQRLVRVDLPLLAPALLVAAVFAASVSLGEFGATLVLLRPEFATVPAEMYRQLASSRPDPWLFPQAMALASILIALNVLVFIALERLRTGRSEGF